MTTIFKHYTGNAMLNNALMTIESIAELNNVVEITPQILSYYFDKLNLYSLNDRFKSYTMLFTKNCLLKTDKTMGKVVYKKVIQYLLNNFSNEGKYVCEITGMHFDKTFNDLYREALKSAGLKEKEIANKDTTINRGWFPLIGSLGSDAQALPQAKYVVQIHPICIPIMQFLPLSSLLYKRRLLLIDSSNFQFTKELIRENTQLIKKQIELTAENKSIENIKFGKGHYLLQAIEVLKRKEFENDYSDLNLWSFSNSGIGASCEIERVPNILIKKLILLARNPIINNELKNILRSGGLAETFLKALENNSEWHRLYPNVFGSGRRKEEYDGVSVNFYEAYLKVIDSSKKIEYAKYLAYLIEKYKTESFEKYLIKRDAHKEKSFHTDLFAVLVKAIENGEWDLEHHIEILDNSNDLPLRNNFYSILKPTHYYYYKKVYYTNSHIPKLEKITYNAYKICQWLIALIQEDNRKEALIKDLVNIQNYIKVNYTNLFFRAAQFDEVDIDSIFYCVIDDEYHIVRYGLNGLLRVFFTQPKQQKFIIHKLEKDEAWQLNKRNIEWLEEINSFTEDYKSYYLNKYKHKETGDYPYNKFLNLLKSIPNSNNEFLQWFYEAIENTNNYLKEIAKSSIIWNDALLYLPNGEFNLSIAKLVIKFTLLKNYHTVNKLTQIINN
nr:hypothetical protein [uncultured Draconibacterium sp.]